MLNTTRLILDTDIGCDCDDAGAMAVLHTLISLGEAEALAMTHTTSTLNGVACIAAINEYYGRGNIPIGCIKEDGFFSDARFDTYATRVAEKFPNKYLNSRCAPDAVYIIRKALASQDDGAVTLVAIGQLRNYAALLRSQADSVSPLDGVALVKKHVSKLVIMGGCFTRHTAEYNIKCDIESAQAVMRLCPVPVIFSGFEIGQQLLSGGALLKSRQTDNPVYWCYSLYNNQPRFSWDQTAILCAVRGAESYWELSPQGTVTVTRSGVTRFNECENGLHRYLMLRTGVGELTGIIDSLMTGDAGAVSRTASSL